MANCDQQPDLLVPGVRPHVKECVCRFSTADEYNAWMREKFGKWFPKTETVWSETYGKVIEAPVNPWQPVSEDLFKDLRNRNGCTPGISAEGVILGTTATVGTVDAPPMGDAWQVVTGETVAVPPIVIDLPEVPPPAKGEEDKGPSLFVPIVASLGLGVALALALFLRR